jgi:hypothetical protein
MCLGFCCVVVVVVVGGGGGGGVVWCVFGISTGQVE